MAIDAKQYLEQLAQTAGLSEEEKQGILKAASNEKFAKSLSEGVEMRSDYSRKMDELSQDKTKWTEWYKGEVAKAQANEKLFAEQQTVIEQLKANGASPELIKSATGDFISKAEMEKLRQQDQAAFINLMKITTDLQGSHLMEFKEKLPVDELEAIAVKKNISLKQAYDELVAPRRAELSTKNLADQLAAAKAEGAREFASTHKIPLDNAPREYHVMLDRDPKKMVGVDDYVPNSGQLSSVSTRQLKANFAEEWEKAAAGNS